MKRTKNKKNRALLTILFVRVPATIIMSDWRGEARKATPSRSKSYLAAAECIISTAQQARPNDMGHIEEARAQLMIWSSFVTTYSALAETGETGARPSRLEPC